jgi:sulfite reductase (NADPH) flavoprotein alpha-component
MRQGLLIAFASQTGLAEELAWMTARSLTDAGTGRPRGPSRRPDIAMLKAAGRLLIVASTTGEGDAPDAVSRFVRRRCWRARRPVRT